MTVAESDAKATAAAEKNFMVVVDIVVAVVVDASSF